MILMLYSTGAKRGDCLSQFTKCSHIVSSRKLISNAFVENYTTNIVSLQRVKDVSDLSIVFNDKLTLTKHITSISSVNWVPGLKTRECFQFSDFYLLLYECVSYALVGTKVEILQSNLESSLRSTQLKC